MSKLIPEKPSGIIIGVAMEVPIPPDLRHAVAEYGVASDFARNDSGPYRSAFSVGR